MYFFFLKGEISFRSSYENETPDTITNRGTKRCKISRASRYALYEENSKLNEAIDLTTEVMKYHITRRKKGTFENYTRTLLDRKNPQDRGIIENRIIQLIAEYPDYSAMHEEYLEDLFFLEDRFFLLCNIRINWLLLLNNKKLTAGLH